MSKEQNSNFTYTRRSEKAFDPTVCFSFYGTWVEAIEELEADGDIKGAYQLFKAIANYAMYGINPEFEESYLRALWRVLTLEVDNAVDRRRKGFRDEQPSKKQRKAIDAHKANPGASCRDIESMTGVSKSTVQRTIKKFCGVDISMDDTSSISDNGDVPGTVSCPAPDTVSDTDNDTYIDSTGTGQNGTLGTVVKPSPSSPLDKILLFTKRKKRYKRYKITCNDGAVVPSFWYIPTRKNIQCENNIADEELEPGDVLVDDEGNTVYRCGAEIDPEDLPF